MQTGTVDVPDTVTEAVRLLRAEGYANDVQLVGDGLVFDAGAQVCPVEVAVVDRLYRFEGPSDPGDEMVVFAVRDPRTGYRGVLASAFGPAADPDRLAHLVGMAERSRQP